MNDDLIMSVGIVAYNEQNYIDNLLNQIYSQTYPKKMTELIFADSCSTDDTKNIFLRFAEKHAEEYLSIKVLDNEGKIQASGWNVILKNFSGDAIIRVDAHAKLTPNFIENNAECLQSGEDVCGGMRPNIIDDPTPMKRLYLAVDRSLFGGSFGKYHSSDKKSYQDTVFHGCYRREVVEKVGLFNETLGRTEDNDFHYRIRKAGYKICYYPKIVSYQYSRSDLKGEIKQKYGNGFWVGRTLAISPKCISLFHFVPFAFFVSILLTIVFGIFCSFIPLAVLLIMYLIADIFLSVTAAINEKPFTLSFFLLPFMFFSLHIAYGIGTFIGILSIIYNKPSDKC